MNLNDLYSEAKNGVDKAIQTVSSQLDKAKEAADQIVTDTPSLSPALVTTDLQNEVVHDAEIKNIPSPSTALDKEVESDGSDLAKKIAVGVGVTVATGLMVALLTGVLQRFARKKAAESLKGGIWATIATIPSLVHPLNPLLKYPGYVDVPGFANSVSEGEYSSTDFYKALARVGHVQPVEFFDSNGAYQVSITHAANIEPIDDFGGFTEFVVRIGEDNYYLCGFLGDNITGLFYREGDTGIYIIRPATFGQIRAGRLEV